MSWRIKHGHVLDVLRTLPEASVQCVVTSPPYWGLRDYGTARWDGGDALCDHRGRVKPRQDTSGSTKRFAATRGTQPGKSAYAVPVREICPCGAKRIDAQIGLETSPDDYVAVIVEVFREVRRVLRDDGTVWLNLGDSYTSGGRKERDPGQSKIHPAYEGERFTDGLRPETPHGLKAKDLVGIPWRVAFALQADGWYLRADVIWNKPNPMPESVTDRPTKAHEYVFLLTKSEQYFYDHEAIKEPAEMRAPWAAHSGKQGVTGQQQSTASERRYTGFNARYAAALDAGTVGGARNRRSVWTITTQPFPEAHFATFPEELPELCIKAGTSEHGACATCGAPYERVIKKGEPLAEQQRACGGDEHGRYAGEAQKSYDGTGAQNASDVKRRILKGMVAKRTVGWTATCVCGAGVRPCVVLDPFAGAGTTGLVADRLGRDFIGIELNAEYLEIARRRITRVAPLFSTEATEARHGA